MNAFKIEKIRGKGRGLIAARRIKTGTVIASDPVIALSLKRYKRSYSAVGAYAFAYGERRGVRNYAAIALGPSSLLNHSETPNCEWYFDNANKHIVIEAIAAISEGQELTISYGWPERKKSRTFGKQHVRQR